MKLIVPPEELIQPILREKPTCIGYYIVSETEDFLKSGCYEPPLIYNLADWFLKRVIKMENKKVFFFKTLLKLLN